MTHLPAWLQAGAAVVQVGFAYFMYRMMVEYVTATKQIAVSTAAQVEVLRASSSSDVGRKDAALALQQHLAVVRDFLQAIPSPTARQDADSRARSAVVVPESHLDGLLSAARKVGASSAETATRLVQSVRWLGERVKSVQQVNRSLGFDWPRFDWDKWGSHYLEASLALNTILQDQNPT